MTVPITSDLAGYALYWDTRIAEIGLGVIITLAPIYILLYRILHKGC